MIGLVTAEVAAPLDPDLEPLAAALRARLGDGEVEIVAWDDVDVDWCGYAALIIRSTWDYADRLDEFLEWVERVDAVTTLVNTADAVRWSIDKRYLEDLAAEGIPITPTAFVAPGEPPPEVHGLHVVKPAIGAGSSGARRCVDHEVGAHVALLHSQGRTAMVQPYLDLLDERGETAHCFVPAANGSTLEFGHAFRKGAILRSTEVEQKGGLFAVEEIAPSRSSDAELELAQRVMRSEVVTSLGRLLFARVDIAPFRDRDGDETFIVMELELIEPSFYFEQAGADVGLFADRLVGWLDEHGLVAETAGS